MNQTIWKYTLETTDVQNIKIPFGANLLRVLVQHNRPQLYAIVNPENEPEEIEILTYGTGHSLDPIGTYPGNAKARHIDSYMVQDGRFVFHVFRGR